MVGTIYRGMAIWEIGKVRSSWGGEPEMERSREKISLGRVLGERLEQVFCHDLASALEITVEVYCRLSGDIVLAVFFFGTVYLRKCILAEVAASLSLVKVWVASGRESVLKLEGVGQWVPI